jgi:hypothetical protein
MASEKRRPGDEILQERHAGCFWSLCFWSLKAAGSSCMTVDIVEESKPFWCGT